MKIYHKKAKLLLIVGILHLGIFGCQKTDSSPKIDNQKLDLSYDAVIMPKVSDNNAARIDATTTAAPTVSKIITKVSCDNCVTLNSVLIPWIGQQNYLEIIGANFGSTIGKSIVITDVNGKSQSSYAFGFLAWSDNSIRLQSGASLTALPMALKFTITTSDGRVVTTTQNVEEVISQKRFGTEPFFVNAARINMGLQPLPTGLYISGLSLSGSNLSNIAKGDVWLFPSVTKVSIVTSVSSRTTNISTNRAGTIDDITFNVTTSEYPNGSFVASNLSRNIIVRKTTTLFTNAPAKTTYQLITSPNAAFNSVSNGQVATAFYR